MPPETPDNITYYTLTLNGTATTWSGGMWTLNGQTVSAPTSGYVKIVATDSSALTVDQAISLANLVVTGDVNTVVNVATNGNGSLYTIKATVESGVFQQGSPAVLGTTPAVVVEDGATFDLNGLAVSESNAFSIEGDGAGNWPWALTSSGGASDIVKTITLTGDATIGGANQIKLGKTKVSNDLTLNGHTLAKTGSGELYCTNLRFFGGGTLDLQGGTTSFNQWTSLDGSESIDRHTTVIVRNGATIVNNAGRRLWIDTLDIRNGTVTTTASGYFGVSSVFTGACDTVHLQLNNGAIAALSGNLTTETMECESASFAKVDGAAPVTVTPGTLTASGAISVGAGITFNLGTSRPAATFAVDDNATISVQKANAADVPMIKVTAQPANIVLYDENGSAVASPAVMYDSENGTISLGTGIIWVGGSGTWSASQFDGKAVETDGKDVSFAQGVPPQSAVTVTVDGAKSVNNMSFNASDTVYTLTGDKITTADGLAASGTAPVVISNELEVAGAVTLGACASLTLATDVFDMADGALSGAGTFVLDPGEGNTITMTKNNTSYTGEAVIKSGTVKMGSATSFGPCLGSGGIRVSSGAIIDTFGCLADTGEGIRTTLILEGGATYTATASTANLEQFPFSTIMLQGYALVDSDYQTGLARKYFDPTVLSLGEYKLTKAGSGTLYLAATAITGAGELDVQEGVLRVNNGYWYNSDNQCSCDNGTIRIGSSASLDLSYYNSSEWNKQQGNSPLPVLRVKNLVLNGSVTRSSSVNSAYYTVTGYITGKGTTPMLTLANGAVFKPSGTGYLRITESLTLPNDNTLTVDISDVDFSAGKSIPLFKVGLAKMLPDAENVAFTGALPDGWVLAKTADGLGYRIRNLNRQLRLILR